MENLKRTPDVASELGTSPQYVNVIIGRHPELKPAKKIGYDYWWTEAEIEAIKNYKANTKIGKPRKTTQKAAFISEARRSLAYAIAHPETTMTHDDLVRFILEKRADNVGT